MSERIYTVKGANNNDLEKRYKAFEALGDQPTIVLERLVELSEMESAVKHLKNSFLFGTMKALLKTKN